MICDGFLVSLGQVSIDVVNKHKSDLIDLLNNKIEGLAIKNVLFKKKPNKDVVMWITLEDVSKVLQQSLIEKLVMF